MSTGAIRYETLGGGIARVEIDRPDKKNALDAAMYESLRAAIATAEASEEVRVLVIAGSGQCFTAGYDIQDFMRNPPRGEGDAVLMFLDALAMATKPLVAAVEGVAIGVGTTLLLHCDLVVASSTARFQLPFIDLGLVPEAASSLLLPRLVGHARAAELLLLGEPFDAQAALAYGLVNRVVPEAAVMTTALDLAARLAAKPPAAVRQSKALLKSASTDVRSRMAEEAMLFARLLRAPEAQEAFRAFSARRAPPKPPA